MSRDGVPWAGCERISAYCKPLPCPTLPCLYYHTLCYWLPKYVTVLQQLALTYFLTHIAYLTASYSVLSLHALAELSHQTTPHGGSNPYHASLYALLICCTYLAYVFLYFFIRHLDTYLPFTYLTLHSFHPLSLLNSTQHTSTHLLSNYLILP